MSKKHKRNKAIDRKLAAQELMEKRKAKKEGKENTNEKFLDPENLSYEDVKRMGMQNFY